MSSNQQPKYNVQIIPESKNISRIEFVPNENQKQKKTLVLDLDETLVHASLKPLNYSDQFSFRVKENFQDIVFYVCKRPGLEPFLTFCCSLFEVVIYTASCEKYAAPVLDHLEKQLGIKFSNRLYRDNCIEQPNGKFVKDISKLGKNLDQIIIIDNSPTAYSLHIKNSMPISAWFCNPNDNALFEISEWLKKIAQKSSVYDTLEEYRKHLNTRQIKENTL